MSFLKVKCYLQYCFFLGLIVSVILPLSAFKLFNRLNFSVASLIALFILLIKLCVTFLFFSGLSEQNILIKSSGGIFGFGYVYHTSEFIPYVFSLMIVCSCIQILISLCENNKDLLVCLLPFIFGVLSVIMMGLSPTVYASGARVFYVFDLTVIFLFILIVNKSRIKVM